jgi:hypothetical protein
VSFQIFQKKVKGCHSKKNKQGIGTTILGETNVISHESKREGAWEGDRR